MPALPTDPISAIEKALARAHNDLPAMAPLLDAFGPHPAGARAQRQNAPGWPDKPRPLTRTATARASPSSPTRVSRT